MTCRETVEFLRHYLDGELPESVHACFEMHLAACPHCVAFVESYRQTISLARDSGVLLPVSPCESIPEPLVAAILRARNSV
jgi:anti-sigma factor RsiW